MKMGLKDIMSRIGALIASRRAAPTKEMDDEETRDKYLRSLRRQKRVIEERGEKKRLKEEIARDNRQENRKMMITPDDENITKQRAELTTPKEKIVTYVPSGQQIVSLSKSKGDNKKEKIISVTKKNKDAKLYGVKRRELERKYKKRITGLRKKLRKKKTPKALITKALYRKEQAKLRRLIRERNKALRLRELKKKRVEIGMLGRESPFFEQKEQRMSRVTEGVNLLSGKRKKQKQDLTFFGKGNI